MNAAGRKYRNAEIASKFARGYSLVTLAPIYNLCERQLERIVREQRDHNPGIFNRSTHAHLEEMLEINQAAIEDLALEAMTAKTTAQRVSAIEAKMRVVDKRKKLLIDVGLLPRFKPPTIRDASALGTAIVRILRSHGVSEEVEAEVIEALAHWFNGSLWRCASSAQSNGAAKAQTGGWPSTRT